MRWLNLIWLIFDRQRSLVDWTNKRPINQSIIMIWIKPHIIKLNNWRLQYGGSEHTPTTGWVSVDNGIQCRNLYDLHPPYVTEHLWDPAPNRGGTLYLTPPIIIFVPVSQPWEDKLWVLLHFTGPQNNVLYSVSFSPSLPLPPGPYPQTHTHSRTYSPLPGGPSSRRGAPCALLFG